ncbi:MAG: DUF5937 family protein [Gemmatimonadales bacterium]
MPKAELSIDIAVTPRFEIFYALQTLAGGGAEHLLGWRREMQRRLTPRVRATLTKVAPSPLIWPLLADALRDSQATPGFTEMMADLRGMRDVVFQRAVLSGVFKTPNAVTNLLRGKATLAETVAIEAATRERLLAVLGLYPFARGNRVTSAFERIVKEPAQYRDEVVNVIVSFWATGFAESWGILEPQMRDRAKALRMNVQRDGAHEFARSSGLPIAIDNAGVRGLRSNSIVPMKEVAGIHVIPSAFNTANLWAAYTDDKGKTRFFVPLLDTTLAPDTPMVINPSLIFGALGDVTRYAIASTIARKPMTSVDLARAFSVSKPTISHHVHLLRSAGLIEETHTEAGTLLALNRRMLERASGAAAREMFSTEDATDAIKRTRKPNAAH